MPVDLTSLRGILGVEGSFLYESAGILAGRDLPTLYADDFLISLQNSFDVAFSTSDQYLGTYDDLWLSYRERVLYIRRLKNLMLCVIALPSCDPDGLRMASSILITQSSRMLSQVPTHVATLPNAVRPEPKPSGFFAPARNAPPPARTPPPNKLPTRPPPKGGDIWG